MKISLSSRPGDVQSLSLPGSVSRLEVAVLRATSCCAARLASRARAARMMRATMDSAMLVLVFEPVFERRTHLRVDGGHHFRIVQSILRLALKLRLLHEDAEHRDKALANVLGGQRDTLRRQVVRFDEVPDRLAKPRAKAVLVSAARSRRNTVDVAANVLVGRLRPLQRDVEPQAVLVALFRNGKRRLMNRDCRALGEDLLEVVGKPLGVLKRLFLLPIPRPRRQS